ncbi:MAG: NAD(P)-dependent oxidoreductase [Euryarchaeota archaeon]|nr:NAD(P)-dependent oxidoreductase [Euryarchaeota archaeon]MBT4650200.1 NAD(P)-dependent oxidoreductase [Euryarchaeota archaeon]MBT5508160.1 NAD(P)-dependent oxidoreductase [Euryarchaeota archaeon]MBT6852725.1 NAD(P)-dependent oxidoreductase [Euryarchaeota archaeon]MBT6933860.1 NAD(P)-dependent oxidoreductase [Euryarchaeota archaeon]
MVWKKPVSVEMKVAITASDSFVAPYIVEMLGKSATIIPDEAIQDKLTLDAMLTPCNALIHINSTSSDDTLDRDDRQTYIAMRERARPIIDAVDRHGSLHLIIVGTLRVHPQWQPGEPFYGLDSTLSPRDTAAEGQLWMEEMALERAQADRPVSVIRASNVQGVPLEGPPGNGLLHKWANEHQMGWINVPGDGSNVKDFIHVEDLVAVIGGILDKPPLTREEIAVGSGKGITMHDLSGIYNSRTGCEIELNQSDSNEVWGVVDAWVLDQRLGFRPSISLEEMIEEAFELAQ